MPGAASGGAWLGVIVPQLPCEVPPPMRPARARAPTPGLQQRKGAGQADHAGADNQDIFA